MKRESTFKSFEHFFRACVPYFGAQLILNRFNGSNLNRGALNKVEFLKRIRRKHNRVAF